MTINCIPPYYRRLSLVLTYHYNYKGYTWKEKLSMLIFIIDLYLKPGGLKLCL